MKSVIRHGVFETNSSSTHSICISTEDCVLDTLRVDEGGTCNVFAGEFGWEEMTYNDPATKASYCLTWAKSKTAQNYLEMLEEVILEVTGANRVMFYPVGSEADDWGYIDHQSMDVCEEAFHSKDSLKSFIFNPKSILVTDNDNH